MNQLPLKVEFYPIFTDVIVSEPPTALSLKNEIASFESLNPRVYNKGK
jgi:hypothetical protein